MTFQTQTFAPTADALERAVDASIRQIPPLWPLAAHVAVNPWLGQSRLGLAETGARLGRLGAGPVTMTRAWYLERIERGEISDGDLAAALAASPHASRPASLAGLKALAAEERPAADVLPTVADLAARHSGTDWPGILADRFGQWAASHFDAGQALWAAPQETDAWLAWRTHAMHDITPEIMGLAGFAAFVAGMPETPEASIARSVARLGLDEAALETFFHRLLLSLGGWAQLARQRLWQAGMAGATDSAPAALLAIRLAWEEALLERYRDAIAAEWSNVKQALAEPVCLNRADIADEILQEAFERSAQRQLVERIAAPAPGQREGRPVLQAAFCIDVRSEVFRRALESVDPSIRTLGFAGFFGIAVSHRGFASDAEELRLPVLLNPAHRSCATGHHDGMADRQARFRARASRAWGRFKLAAVSSFAFVEAMGPAYVARLLRDALRLKGAAGKREPKPRFFPEPDLAARIEAAGNVLRAMGLTRGFARIVLLAGHGASVVNNPHASGLQCGACGGHSGEVNARLLAGLLNDPAVREGLAHTGIAIPADTLFVAALHDTTTDAVTLYDGDSDTARHAGDLEKVAGWLQRAGRIARAERALRLPRADGEAGLPARARDWSQTRPEWGLAGCRAFIAAPRTRTAGRDLAGQAFLHDYDWRRDSANGFAVLELIMTAPVVVASWISLQYYGSTVAPQVFGAGNKLLHNVVGGIGVVEGNGGLLRGGLPWQSVHDGERFVHEPLRLSVMIEAPREAMSQVLRKHEAVRALFDNRWLHLIALDDSGKPGWRYSGDLEWESWA
ncbi:MAG: DUF2309 domain-containing protein [Zhengella sp.]|uniref:YbcC family protein n=1 Tax=Zhengella sp. TaxID=2282762 RepID=UPI003528C9C0|nr:DUF2309 domain-containing protein [Brucellaceae bacterium]